ncbi:MAG: hypothetical protein KF819_19340 [Labilithrix sp.]|nr:hypothetical protein [Labilithrix sp.]
MDVADVPTYEIGSGGPLRRMERALHVARDDPRDPTRRALIAVAIAYLPILAVGIGWRIVAGRWSDTFVELLPHMRVLVTLPLLILAESFISLMASEAGRYLVEAELIAPERREAHGAVVARTSRLRDSAGVEGGLAAVALVSIVVLPALTRSAEPVVRWSLLPSIFLYRFLLLRLIWRWCLWAVYLRRLSRLPLSLHHLHPDRVAGLEPLSGPSAAFGTVVMAVGCSLAAGWGDRMRFEGISLAVLPREIGVYVALALLAATAPLASFSGLLLAERRRGLRVYGAFANRYAGAFEHECMQQSGHESLGASSIQALNDLGGSFERVEAIRMLLLPRAVLVAVVAGALVPMLPLALADAGFAEALLRVGEAIF